MNKVFVLLAALLVSVLFSGCALVGHHTANVENGTKTTVGLFTFDNLDNGYPMIPFYSGYEQTK